MRNDKSDRNNIERGAEIYSLFKIKGVNLDGLLNYLQKKGVNVYSVKKTDAKTMKVGIKFADEQKFFAICRDLWYTDIVKVKEYGKGYALLFFARNLGLLLGAAFLVAAMAFFGDFIFAFSYSGTGAVCRREVQKYLNDSGVTVFSRFSDKNLKTLSDGILADNPRLTFARCSKNGNRLQVYLVLKEDGRDVLSPSDSPLVSDTDGVIKEIKIYRGTAVKNAGDEIKAGEIIAQPYSYRGEECVQTQTLGYAVIEARFIYEYVSDFEGQEEAAELFAKNALGEHDTDCTVDTIKKDDVVVYRVTLKYERIIYSG